jgi:hypothetical protein
MLKPGRHASCGACGKGGQGRNYGSWNPHSGIWKREQRLLGASTTIGTLRAALVSKTNCLLSTLARRKNYRRFLHDPAICGGA